MNTQARVNIPFGRSLAQLAVLPRGAKRDLQDPYAQKASALPHVISGLAVVAFGVFVLARLGMIPAAAAPVAP